MNHLKMHNPYTRDLTVWPLQVKEITHIRPSFSVSRASHRLRVVHLLLLSVGEALAMPVSDLLRSFRTGSRPTTEKVGYMAPLISVVICLNGTDCTVRLAELKSQCINLQILQYCAPCVSVLEEG